MRSRVIGAIMAYATGMVLIAGASTPSIVGILQQEGTTHGGTPAMVMWLSMLIPLALVAGIICLRISARNAPREERKPATVKPVIEGADSRSGVSMRRVPSAEATRRPSWVCAVCKRPLDKALRCRECNAMLCRQHLPPDRHDCPRLDPHGDRAKNTMVLILILLSVTAVLYLAFFRGSGFPEPLTPLDNATTLSVLWSLDLSGINMTQSHQSCPTVADIDGDGSNEILLAYRRPFGKGCGLPGENRLLCATEKGEVEWIYPPLDRPEMGGHPMTTPTITDLDGDGLPEILIGRRGDGAPFGAVICIDSHGEEIWNFTMNMALGAVTAEPQIYDNDKDGVPEIYVASGTTPYGFDARKGRMLSLSPDGELLWCVDLDGYAQWPPLVWDIDQDGLGEVVACLNNNQVVCLEAADGSEKWRTRMPTPPNQTAEVGQVVYPPELLSSNPAAADVDKDGEYEILVAGYDGDFYILSHRGKREWRFKTPGSGPLTFTFPLGDIDGDTNLETCFMDDELVYCLDLYDRSLEWTFKPETPNHYSNYNTFADVTGDGEIDVLVVAPCLYVLSNQGIHQAIFQTENMWRGDRAENGIWAGDLNHDGLVEILVKFEGDGLYCLATNASYNPVLMPWPKSLSDLANRPVLPICQPE